MSDQSGIAEQVAKRLLAVIEGSGYGTTRPDRYTPTFHVEDVKVLAEAALSDNGRPSDG